MAKTLKDFLEGYLKVKSADEQKFIDKHVTAKTTDRNGNGDDVFNGNTKTIDRRKSRKGYNPGEDEKVYEALKGNQHKIDANKNGKVDAHDFKLLRGKKKVAEEAEELDEVSAAAKDSYAQKAGKQLPDLFKKSGKSADDARKYYNRKNTVRKIANEEVEELEELSKGTLGRYINKAGDNKAYHDRAAGRGIASDGDADEIEAHLDKSDNRKAGINRAVKKLAKEETVQVDEKLDMKKASMGTVIKDFKKSDAPQFAGKSAKKRQVMAIAAKLTAERGGKPLNKEERLQDRLSDISESHQRVMLNVFEKLNEDNKTKFMTACATPEGVEQMLDFAITYRGE
jgi:hypothetical protein